MSAESMRSLYAIEGALLALLLILFLVARDLPMVDLPQHAAQLSAWVNLDNPEYHGEQFVLNLRTPYLLGYVLARCMLPFFGVVGALKLVVWLAVAGQLLGLHFLCRRMGHDPWLSLFAIPLALGYNFLFGFINFVVALPLLYLCIGVAVGYRERPSLKGGVILTGALTALLVAHGIAFAQALMFVGPLVLLGCGPIWARVAPLLVAVLIGTAWLASGPLASRLGRDVWTPSFSRLLSLPGLLVGSGSGDSAASVGGGAFLLLLLLAVGPLARDAARQLPGTFVLVGFLAFPSMYRGYGPLWPRFAVLLVPALLLAFEPESDATRSARASHRRTLLFAVSVWLALFGFRLYGFNRETQAIHSVVASLPRGLRVRPIVFEPQSVAFPGLPALNHLPAYYFVDKGGVQGYSFAMYPSSLVRYRDGVVPKMGGGQEWNPDGFSVDAEWQDYDCCLVHSVRDRFEELFGAAASSVEIQVRAGNWWGYCRKDPQSNRMSLGLGIAEN